MGKKRSIYDLSGVNPMQVVSSKVTKRGKLKGDTKKETKMLKSICPHMTITRKGKKTKPHLDVHGKTCTCRLCKERMRTKFYSDDELNNVMQPTKEVLSQSKLMMASIGADMDTQREVAELNLRFDNFQAIYKRGRKIAQKRENLNGRGKKKKKETKSAFGSWQVRG